MKKYVWDRCVVLKDGVDEGGRVLFEGGEGVMVDMEEGR
nr:hypothetical protein [Bacillus subtilis]